MKMLSVSGRPSNQRIATTVRLGLCAVLLAAAGSVTGFAQTPGEDPRPGRSIGLQAPRIVETKCATCHGIDGNSSEPQFPKLAGQNGIYLYSQLWAFKQGTRRSDVMSAIVTTLSDADIADVAQFYSRQQLKPDSIRDQRLAAVGEGIFFAGMPACAMCHGPGGRPGMPMMGHMPMMGMMGHGMMGMMGPGSVPKLNGQHAAYIVDQLNRFAAGARQGMVMNEIAASLSEHEKKAVAEFLSGLR